MHCWAVLAGLGVVAITTACSVPAEPTGKRVTPSYDEYTRRLTALYADQDGDGRIDQWTYFDGNRLLRGEKDTDGDGRVDQWEYFAPDGRLERVGTSSGGDGIEDSWTWPAPADQEGRVDRASARDRRIDRHEFFRGGVLVRAEDDTNGDGRVDRWDVYDGTMLRRVEFDTTFSGGRPNRRVVYGKGGQFERLEADPELDGTFVMVPGGEPPDVKSGVRK